MSEVEKAIERQVLATESAPASVKTGGAAWYEADTKSINEPLLVAALIDEHGLIHTKQGYANAKGQRLSPDQLKKIVFETIGAYVPHRTAQTAEHVVKALKAAIPEKNAVPEFNTFSAADLAGETIPQTPFVIDKILPCGFTIIAAPPKTGKSWLCLAMGDAVATGCTFWGYNVNPGAVLYLALEDSKHRLQDRLRIIGSTMPPNFYMATQNALCLDSGLIDQLDQWISRTKDARLIILDTLQRVKGAAQRGVDAYAADYNKLAPLQAFAIEKNVAIVAVHHFRKQQSSASEDPFERIAGSTALFGATDCAWVINGKRGEKEKTLMLTARDAGDMEFKISFDDATARWQMIGDSEQIEEQRRLDLYRTNPLSRTIRELVQESGGRWTGNATALFEETYKRTGKAPAKNSKDLYNVICNMRDLLFKNDGIFMTHATGGRYGRGYTFTKGKQHSFTNGGAYNE